MRHTIDTTTGIGVEPACLSHRFGIGIRKESGAIDWVWKMVAGNNFVNFMIVEVIHTILSHDFSFCLSRAGTRHFQFDANACKRNLQGALHVIIRIRNSKLKGA